MRPLIAANWKMHGDMNWNDKPDAFNRLLPAEQRRSIDVLICPPFPYILSLTQAAKANGIVTGAQDCHFEEQGAYTGSVSAQMVKNCGAEFVIVGHSERRAVGESDKIVRLKAEAALKAGLTPIVCVGEPLFVREDGNEKAHVEAQLKESLPQAFGGCVIAYEPIWAIGTGRTASSGDIADMHAHIRGLVGAGVRILYGGSVKPENAGEILGTVNVNGALIGGAGLEMESLAQIARAAL